MLGTITSQARVRQLGFSVADQALSVAGTFLVNVALARTQTREVYGIFALCYSTFTFLAGLHNAMIVETYTVYGAGRYQRHLASYSRYLWNTNWLLTLAVSLIMACAWLFVRRLSPSPSHTILGLACFSSLPLTALFLRRTFYLRRRPDLAARFSMFFFLTCAILVSVALWAHRMNGFSAFAIIGTAWALALLAMKPELPRQDSARDFPSIELGYWGEHWKYARWVLVTAFVFQLTTQGYYWLAAALVSVRDVANLRAMLNIVVPMDQVFTATNLLVLPILCAHYEAGHLVKMIPLWKKYCIGWLVLTTLFAMAVLLGGGRAMHVLYGGVYDDVSHVVAFMAFLPVIMGVGHTINAALKSAERPDLVFGAYVCSGAATLVLGIPLVIRHGLTGAVYGLLASAVVYSTALGVSFMWVAGRFSGQLVAAVRNR
jgi:O-antigen/teichoic acid export membrane protein